MQKFLQVRTILIGCILLFICARLLLLSTIPPGLYVDESAIAYNAYSILRTGKDEFGTVLPLFFKSFGDYKNGLYVYSQIPFIFLFGLNAAASRLTSAIWGLATIFLFYHFVRSRSLSVNQALFAIFLFLCNPWHFQLSRVSFEVISYPFFLIAAIFALWRFQLLQQKKIWLYYFALLLGISVYTYTSARLLSPLLFGVAMLLYARKLPFQKTLQAILIFVLSLMPLFLWEWMNPGTLLARFHTVGLSFSKSDFFTEFLSNYLSHFDPRFLLLFGDGYLRHTPGWHSVFLWSSVPFLLLGIYSTLKRRSTYSFWLLLGFLLSPIPAALTQQAPHALRSIGMLPFGMCLMVLGIEEIVRLPKNWKLLWIPLTLAVCIESIFFMIHYTTVYSKDADMWFDVPIHTLFRTAFSYPSPYFLSLVPYSGNYVTAYVLLQAPPQQVQDGTYKTISLFDIETAKVFPTGTYIFDDKTCAALPPAFVTQAHQVDANPDYCLYTVSSSR